MTLVYPSPQVPEMASVALQVDVRQARMREISTYGKYISS
jgi:hypothetical protein